MRPQSPTQAWVARLRALFLPSATEGFTGSVLPIAPVWVVGAIAIWLVAIDNLTFWRTFLGAQPNVSLASITAVALLALVLALAFATGLSALSWPVIRKPVWCLVLLASSFAAHFVDGWSVLIDRSMVRNVLETDSAEALDLVTWGLVLDILFRGLLPAAIVAWLPVRKQPVWRLQVMTVCLAMATATVFGVAFATLNSVYAPTFRNHRELRLQLVPSNYMNGILGLAKPSASTSQNLQPVALDAKRTLKEGSRPLLVVLVVGETARASSFSLGGYGKDTNAALTGKDIAYFENTQACGTDTATSLPCMFSDLGVGRFSPEVARNRENVLDVLQRVGIDVRWLENNSGCKGVCSRVPTIQLPSAISAGCQGPNCFDGALVPALSAQLSGMKNDALVVMHQQGSHGPAYYRRYPGPGAFTPTCDTNAIQSCSREALINTYDNTIAYTSQVLAKIIDRLDSEASDRDTALIYLSDHGESLGESGLFLHGLPLLLAPQEQRAIPLLMWLSDGAERRLATSVECLERVSGRSWNHDSLFHTLLGLYEVSTHSYVGGLDVFSAARSNGECRR